MNEPGTIETPHRSHVGQASCLPVNAASSRVFPTTCRGEALRSQGPKIHSSIYPTNRIVPTFPLDGGQFAGTRSKTLIFRISFTPMALARPAFSVIRCIFAGKTVSKSHFSDHQKGQFPFRQCHRPMIHLSGFWIPPTGFEDEDDDEDDSPLPQVVQSWYVPVHLPWARIWPFMALRRSSFWAPESRDTVVSSA